MDVAMAMMLMACVTAVLLAVVICGTVVRTAEIREGSRPRSLAEFLSGRREDG